MVKVREIMKKQVAKLHYFSTLENCYKIFKEAGISSVAVIKNKKLVGQVERQDILKLLKKKNLESISEKDIKKLRRIRVFRLLKKCETVFEDENVEIAIKKMNENNLPRLFVIDKKNNLVGIFSRSDILKIKRREGVFTTVDYMLETIKEKNKISIKNLSKILNLPEDLIESWAKALEEIGEIEIEYPAIGSIILKKKS